MPSFASLPGLVPDKSDAPVPDRQIKPELYELLKDLRAGLQAGGFKELAANVYTLEGPKQVISFKGLVDAACKHDFIRMITAFHRPDVITFVLGLPSFEHAGKIPVTPRDLGLTGLDGSLPGLQAI